MKNALNTTAQKPPFSKRHPKLNTLFGFAILIVLFVGVIIFIKWLISSFVNLVSAVNSMDAVVITTIIAGTVSIISVVISSIVGKRIEFKKARQEYLAQKREKPYGDFIEMVYRLMMKTEKTPYNQEDMVKDLSSFSREITLWGSKEVVKKWVQFRKNATSPEGVTKNLLLIEDIMNEMRKDLGTKKTKQKELLGFFVNDVENISDKKVNKNL